MENLTFLLVLITIGLVHSFEFSSLAEVKELRNYSYGNSLIETITLTLRNKGSIEEVQKLLDDLLYKLNKDTAESNKNFEVEIRQLTEKIENLTREVESLRVNTVGVTKKELKLAKKSVKIKKLLTEYKKQKEEDQLTLQNLENIREKDNAEYKKSLSDHNDVINALEAVLFELSKLTDKVNGVSNQKDILEKIIQEKQKKENEKSQKQELEKKKQLLSHIFLQLSGSSINNEELNAFVEMATSADETALNKLIELLNKMEESAKRSLNADEINEQKSIKIYNKYKQSLLSDISKLDNVINEAEKNIRGNTDELNKLQSKNGQLTALLNSKKEELASTIKEKNDRENQHNLSLQEKEKEKKVVLRLQKIVKQRVANMSKFLKDRTGS